MSSDKVMEIQHQVKENSEELHDFIRDLGSWQKEMEAKDKQLKMSKPGVDKSEKVSETEAPKIKEEKTKKKILISEVDSSNKAKEGGPKSGKREGAAKPDESKPVPKKIKSYDYAAWDKFDVDKALEEAEVEDVDVEGEEDSDEEQFLIQQAVVEKDKGNEFFKTGEYAAAIDCYTKGIQCDPANPILPANRAMAFLKTGQIAAAEADCTLAISLDPTYVKAYHRRASARVSLKRLKEAIGDFEKVLELEPKNKLAKNELDKLKEQMAKSPTVAAKPVEKPSKKPVEKLDSSTFEQNLKASFSKPKEDRPTMSDKNVSKESREQVFPVDKNPHQRSKKPMHRIEIVDVDEDVISTSTLLDTDGTKFSDKIELFSPMGDSEIKMSTSSASKIDKIEIISSTTEDIDTSLLQGEEEKIDKSKKNVSEGLQRKVEEEILQSMSDKLSLVGQKSDSTKSKFSKAPKTSVQFLSEWRQLKTCDGRSNYLKLISNPAKDYIRIFKHSMEADIFTDIVDILTSTDFGDVSSHVLGMSRVPRMSALVMFLKSEEKIRLKKLFESARQSSSLSQSEKKEIEKAFSF